MTTISAAAQNRSPTVLVTDAREQRRQPPNRPTNILQRQPSRFITVDNVLQYASDIPSMQERVPLLRPQALRTPSGRPAAPKLSGRLIPPNKPSRTTKVSEKLVLIPDHETSELDMEEKQDFEEDNDAAPERDDEERRRMSQYKRGKSYAERLPKSRRTEKLSRVTAYCTAQSYKLKPTATFLKDHHGARTKLYDDCLYAVYHLPLVPGSDGYRVRSSPVLKNPGGKAVLDEEIERSERRDYQEGFFDEDGGVRFSIRGTEDGQDERRRNSETTTENGKHPLKKYEIERRDSDRSVRSTSPSRIAPDAFSFAEMYIFSYGVAVFWNFTAKQEKDVLADLTFFSSSSILNSLVVAPQDEDDFETEEFHFEYNTEIAKPRVFNDMITLRSGDHMIKLTMSHAIAQSTKLSYFEQQMANQMTEAQHVPRQLALTGKLGLTRGEVVRILGALFKSRVDVNLSSNVLDTPSFFWSSEPTLNPLYTGIREYLEINQRIKVLNERCRVFLDLAEILTDSIADTKMSKLTWIIIVLICLSILVTCSEVVLRFGMLSTKGAIGRDNTGDEVLGRAISGALCACACGSNTTTSSSAGEL